MTPQTVFVLDALERHLRVQTDDGVWGYVDEIYRSLMDEDGTLRARVVDDHGRVHHVSTEAVHPPTERRFGGLASVHREML